MLLFKEKKKKEKARWLNILFARDTLNSVVTLDGEQVVTTAVD